jgi:antitoxin PrlF
MAVTALKGMFGKPAKTISIDEMNAVIAKRGASAGSDSGSIR